MPPHLPPFPNLIFTIFEPLSLLAGFLSPLLTPQYFISSQLPTPSPPNTPSPTTPPPTDTTTTLLARQLGNTYLLLGLLGLFILHTTSEVKVVRAYLWALWVGDIGHVGFTLWAMGWEGFVCVAGWNAVVWGNVGVTGFLFGVRSLYFWGAFGEGGEGKGKGKGKGKRG
ncbi:hypothetical protein EG328_002428 [Venturia inaequalis]|uniref:DUF7704 domain-containing protein n=1 Tax=Venturia inaequalis TaxID=5025 RepID=A0A8H3UWS2_VENIN|nr:hypothetical protein EG328_002428 [Venturia inaequalis]